jgi:hypothetical protein
MSRCAFAAEPKPGSTADSYSRNSEAVIPETGADVDVLIFRKEHFSSDHYRLAAITRLKF